jgi:hypothetical protein
MVLGVPFFGGLLSETIHSTDEFTWSIDGALNAFALNAFASLLVFVLMVATFAQWIGVIFIHKHLRHVEIDFDSKAIMVTKARLFKPPETKTYRPVDIKLIGWERDESSVRFTDENYFSLKDSFGRKGSAFSKQIAAAFDYPDEKIVEFQTGN